MVSSARWDWEASCEITVDLSCDGDYLDEAKVTAISISWLRGKRIFKELYFNDFGSFLCFVFWFFDWFRTALILALVIHVSFDGGFGVGRVLAEGLKCKSRECIGRDVFAFECCFQC